MKRILLIEDEIHKRDELTTCLLSYYKGLAELDQVDSVHTAYWAVSNNSYDLVVLDMALPTFSTEGGATERGQDQALGGVEILRTLRSRKLACKVLIITQYPDITVGGKRVKLAAAAEVLSKRYGQDIIGGVLYKYKSPANATKITALLKKVP